MRRHRSASEYVDGLLAGDRTILGKAITLIESSRPEDEDLAEGVLEACLPHAGNSVRVGITGVPGVGKSSVVEALGAHVTSILEQNIAVLAIDPSSEVSRGSILGDKTRMATLSTNERAFVRPTASGGSLGGVGRRTREAMLLCEAAGYRNIIVETVGVGQSETAVRSMVDFFLLLLPAQAGDELQGMKRGISEMADLVAINKADGDNLPRAEAARREHEAALGLFSRSPKDWAPRVATCSAATGDGIPQLWETVLEHHRFVGESGWLDRARREQARSWMREAIDCGLRERFRNDPAVRRELPECERQVAEGRASAFHAARRLLKLYSGRA